MMYLLVLTLAIGSTLGQAPYRPDYSDLRRGQYCERLRGTQPGNCCPDRLDDCSSPILDTLCYCDEFCDRGASGDCCPDYFSYCLGEKGPDPVIAGCNHRGRKLLPEQSVKENCNICKCVKVSDTLAELMCDTSKCLVQPELIGDINSQDAYGWRASNYSQFWGKKLNSGLQYLLGTRYPNDMINQMYPITKVFDPSLLPRSFDARTKREWRGLIGPVEDQGWCGASWAFSTATTAADRLAIQNPGRRRLDFSEQNVIDCGYVRDDGCLGGNLDRAWNYLRRFGVVEEECYQYRSGETSSSGECQTPRRSSRPYQLTCANGTTIQLSRDEMIGMQPPYRIASKEQDIMHELYYSGPVQAIMQVHEDFFSYRSGVYRPTRLRQSSRTAHHSVRLLGWGEQPGPRGEPVKYWIAANSWGRQWGEDGLFRIVRGQNEADIETFVVGAWAKPSRGDRRRSRGYRQYRRNRRHHLRARRHHKTTKQ